MLNLNVDIKINTGRPRMPLIIVGKNQCIHCASEGTLEKIDIFGNTSKQEIYPLEHIRCKACGYTYSIKWEDNGKGELIPVPVNPSIKQEIVNTMNYLKIRKNGKKEI